MNVAISTLAFQGHTIEEIVQIAKEQDWTIEFSSGLPYRPDLKAMYENAEIRRIPHNYFPPPENAFVLNLASMIGSVRERSIAHCLQGLELARVSQSPFFSAHAGFCGDPAPEELGNKISFHANFDRGQYWTNFVLSVEKVLESGRNLGVDFLIENNVCSRFNITAIGENPLLCSSPDEIEMLFETIGNPAFGLLLDTAHLKVSSSTLGFDLFSAVDRIKPFIKGIHHSDNDGLIDDNGLLDENYWFLPWMKEFCNVTHVLEVKGLETCLMSEQLQLLKGGNI